MKILVCLLCLMAFATSGFSYTVVLKSGKKIEGTLLSEDENTLRIKDADGLTISYRKLQLDLEATRLANEGAPLPKNEGSAAYRLEHPPQKVSPLGSLAAANKQRQKSAVQQTKVFKNEDIGIPPEGNSSQTQEVPNDTQGYSGMASGASWVDAEMARYEAARDELNRLRTNMQIAAAECLKYYSEMGGGSVWTNYGFYPYSYSGQGTVYSPAACDLALQIKAQLEVAQEEFRQQGVPWKYLE